MRCAVGRCRAAGEDYAIPEDVAEKIGVAVQRIRSVGMLAREIEWYASGDHGDDTIREILTSI